MQDITKLLVDAGYSRAGDMAAGEEFDKVRSSYPIPPCGLF